MMKSEFENLAGREVTDEQYRAIETLYITALYKQSKASMRATQKQLRSLIEYHFREAGGYKKVLCDSFLVAPPLFLGENSPREFQ